MSLVRSLLSVSLLGATFLYLHRFTADEVAPIRRPLRDLPARIADWREVSSTILDDEELDILKPTDYLLRRYVDPKGRSVWLYVGYWASQRKGAQIHSPKNCLPGGGWEPLEARRRQVSIPGRRDPIEINDYVLQKGSDQQVAVYWFQSQGQVVASEMQAKIELVRGAILNKRTDGAIVRVSGPVAGSIGETSDLLVKYIQAMYPMLDEFLPN